MSELYINGQQVKGWKEVGGLNLDDDSISFDLPGYIIMEESKFEKWIGEFDQDDADKFREITRMDTDQMQGKRVRIYLQILGPVQRQGR